jgi:hypothetical protein
MRKVKHITIQHRDRKAPYVINDPHPNIHLYLYHDIDVVIGPNVRQIENRCGGCTIQTKHPTAYIPCWKTSME